MTRASCCLGTFLLLLATLTTPAHSDVVLTFDSDTQGFSDSFGNGSVAWSSFNDGSLQLNFTSSGWTNPVAVMSMTNEFVGGLFPSILSNGGTVTFDYFVAREDISGYDPSNPPGWFELVLTGNSNSDFGGGWDQNVIGGSAGYYGGIPEGYTLKQVTVGLGAGPPADNNIVSWGVGSGWNELLIGLNSPSNSFTSGTVYIDNMRFSAIPEPGSAMLLTFSTLGFFARRRR